MKCFDTRFPLLIPPPVPLEFDTDVLIRCVDILRIRTVILEYQKQLKNLRKKVVVLPENDDELEEEDLEVDALPPDDEVSASGFLFLVETY